MAPTEVVRALLDDPTDPEAVQELVAPGATHVSLDFANPELKRILPWAGTSRGPDAVLSTSARVGRFWRSEAFEIEELFGTGEDGAVFGRSTHRSTTLGKAATSPSPILAKVSGGPVAFMQFVEDTFATAATFREGGTAVYRSGPDGGRVEM